MSEILQLDRHTSDLIAAGEVVERPASVVKELMENSFDAGAGHITVEIRSGGMSYIRVTDDGKGIEPDDVETAFLRHATSKLRDARGLEAIATLGFRGEALAAISAVSKIELTTRRAGKDEGRLVRNEGGRILSNDPCGCPVGTTFVVEDLFYNTPARLKFMKTDRAEGSAVTGIVTRLALSHPGVSVKYIREGKTEIHTPGDGRVDSCVYSLFGRDFYNDLLPVSVDDGVVSVTGYVSAPARAKGNRSSQFFFVNGRSIQSKQLQTALEQAYRNNLFTGKYPACILFIQISCGSVDVNVHPTKNEVKFSNGNAVFEGIYYGTLGALEHKKPLAGTSALPASAPAASQYASDISPLPSSPAGSVPQRGYSGTASGSVKPRADAFRTMSADDFRARQSSASGGKKASSGGVPLSETGSSFGKKAGFVPSPVFPSESVRPAAAAVPSAPAKVEEPEQVTLLTSEQNAAKDKIDTDMPAWRVIGEAMNTYILVESGSSLWLIDKHAAHERIHFDRLKAQQRETMIQPLLLPVICRFSPEEAELLLEQNSILERFGFSVEAFGQDSLAVRQIPSHLEPDDVEEVLSEICTALKLGGAAAADDFSDRILHSIACKAAIKAGKSSEPSELKVLAARVMSGEIRYCPHGRPVAVEMTKAQLDKSFKRT